jgi:hypothetical protein
MKKIKKIVFLFLVNRKKIFLFIETYFYLGLARILINRPLSKLSSKLGCYMKETTYDNNSNIDELKIVSHSLKIISNYTFWESKCLVQAIAGLKMLERRDIESTLYLGTARDENGKMIAHAWLRSGSNYITGHEVMNNFTIVGKFAKDITKS